MYFDTIVPVLSTHLNIELQSNELYNYNNNPINALCDDSIEPAMVTADNLTEADGATLTSGDFSVAMCGTATSATYGVVLTNSYMTMSKSSTVTATFKGNNVGGMLLKMYKTDVELQYSIDGGEWETFVINDSRLRHQKYTHVQAFSLKNGFDDKEHTITLKFTSENNIYLGAIPAEK